MTVTCYTVSDDRKVVNKTLSNAHVDLTINNKSSIDMINPIFEVYYTNTGFTYNYLYCGGNGYYYYIDSYTILTGGRILINCSLDVRKTLSSFIKNDMSCTILRSSKGITQFSDSKLPVEPNKCRKEWHYMDSPFTQSAIARRVVVGVFNSR